VSIVRPLIFDDSVGEPVAAPAINAKHDGSPLIDCFMKSIVKCRKPLKHRQADMEFTEGAMRSNAKWRTIGGPALVASDPVERVVERQMARRARG